MYGRSESEQMLAPGLIHLGGVSSGILSRFGTLLPRLSWLVFPLLAFWLQFWELCSDPIFRFFWSLWNIRKQNCSCKINFNQITVYFTLFNVFFMFANHKRFSPRSMRIDVKYTLWKILKYLINLAVYNTFSSYFYRFAKILIVFSALFMFYCKGCLSRQTGANYITICVKKIIQLHFYSQGRT